MERIVLAYSGGLDTSVAVKWLADKYDAEIVTVTIDLGQGKELDDVRERALAVGAVRAHVVDAREEFARDYIVPALQAGAIYESRYPLATALGRPLIAKKLVEIAEMEDAGIIAHGCTGKGNDQLRFEAIWRGSGLEIAAPIRDLGLTRTWEIQYAKENNLPIKSGNDGIWSIDTNLWSRSIEGGELEDPRTIPPSSIYPVSYTHLTQQTKA